MYSSNKQSQKTLIRPTIHFNCIKKIYDKVPVLIRLISFGLVLFISTSHESKNPLIGKSNVEFYLPAISDNIKDACLTSMSDSMCFDQHVYSLFYKQLKYFPVWTKNFNLNPLGHAACKLIENAMHYGLVPGNYQLHEIRSLKNRMVHGHNEESKFDARKNLELVLTASIIKLAIHINAGLIQLNNDSTIHVHTKQLVNYLENSHPSGSLSEFTVQLHPKNLQYLQLQQALAMYVERVKIDTIYGNLSLPIADSLAFYNNVTRALVRHGYCTHTDTCAQEIVLRLFQKNHGLDTTGVINTATINALNRSTFDIFRKAALNLDRLRKAKIQEPYYAFVNIPQYKLYLVEQNKLRLQHNVVVGRPSTPTPELSSYIDRIITNPHWTVPKSITVNEIIPKIISDSTYLQRNQFYIIDKKENVVSTDGFDWSAMKTNPKDYWIRQRSSSWNALGQVKFIFPNSYRVYLHDTPSKRLFGRSYRAYSHGCIRLEHPEKFADYLAKNYLATKTTKIKQTIKSGKQREYKLADSLAIHINYITCSADSNLNLIQHPDIYKKDDKAIRELFN
jgi:murein L,D-transpeptidase YcbB/YkuD